MIPLKFGREASSLIEPLQDRNLKSINDFRMFDDTFMSAVFDGKTEETQFLIRVILEEMTLL